MLKVEVRGTSIALELSSPTLRSRPSRSKPRFDLDVWDGKGFWMLSREASISKVVR